MNSLHWLCPMFHNKTEASKLFQQSWMRCISYSYMINFKGQQIFCQKQHINMFNLVHMVKFIIIYKLLYPCLSLWHGNQHPPSFLHTIFFSPSTFFGKRHLKHFFLWIVASLKFPPLTWLFLTLNKPHHIIHSLLAMEVHHYHSHLFSFSQLWSQMIGKVEVSLPAGWCFLSLHKTGKKIRECMIVFSNWRDEVALGLAR